ncbi:MAG: UDP-N-acetylglucosamine 2-epimerase (non-hydrolyzing) [Nitrospinae bacterium]|nr:UDP-N-acetylglucosamine 2-epimerase (non-hydrolyzing) [Nitrospinota bacterium]
MKIINVTGARPNMMKVAPLIKEIKIHKELTPLLLHTGQHYDEKMSKVFFNDLSMPEPDIYLGVGSGSHAVQTAKVMVEFEKVLLSENPDFVVVVGDVNSTMACAITAVKLHIPVAHVEAGLRSFDRTMPEEINRIVTDSVSDYLFTTSEDANENLKKEGIPAEKIFFVGNVMIDTLLNHKEKADRSDITQRLGLKKGEYAVLTLHRPSNVDGKESLERILDALLYIQKRIKIVFPVHPRTLKMIKEYGFSDITKEIKNLIILEPLGYLDFLKLMNDAMFVLTDSGGIQEETTILQIPCLTLRENTERPVTVMEGTNTIVGNDKERIIKEAENILNNGGKAGRVPKLWDGRAAERIVEIIIKREIRRKGENGEMEKDS